MLDIGFYHPLVIHFAISLVIIGVLLRLLSLTGRASFTGPAATILLLLGTVAVAVEAIPGIASAVREHQLWGERTRNLVLAVAACEVLALVLRRAGWARPAVAVSGLLGLISVACVMQTGKLGGELVYAYAGGIGIRSGEPADVGRLLLAGLYHQAQLDETAGRAADATMLLELAAQRFPADDAVQVLAAESLLVNRHDPAAALTALRKITIPKEERRWRFRHGWLMAEALEALGQTDAARVTLQNLQVEFPDSERLRRRLEQANSKAG
jgi:uncharacterized membrane protein